MTDTQNRPTEVYAKEVRGLQLTALKPYKTTKWSGSTSFLITNDIGEEWLCNWSIPDPLLGGDQMWRDAKELKPAEAYDDEVTDEYNGMIEKIVADDHTKVGPQFTEPSITESPTTVALGELIAAHDWGDGLKCKREAWGAKNRGIYFETLRDGPLTVADDADVILTATDLSATDWIIVPAEPEKLTPAQICNALEDMEGADGMDDHIFTERALEILSRRTNMEGE